MVERHRFQAKKDIRSGGQAMIEEAEISLEEQSDNAMGKVGWAIFIQGPSIS
jgi:hypothetical protein